MPCGKLCSATQTGSNSIASLVGFVKRISQKITTHHRHRQSFGVTGSGRIPAAAQSAVWLPSAVYQSPLFLSHL